MTLPPSDEPATVRLTTALLIDLEDVAIKAVIARDLPSLKALNEMRVDLRRALMQSVRCGFHEITRGLRRLGVPVTEYLVHEAVSKSPESYWHLCGDQAVPLFPEAALRAAVEEGKFTFAHELLDRWHVAVMPDVIGQINGAKKPVPRQLLEKLFSRLPDSEFTDGVLCLAATHGTPAIIDRAVPETKDCDTLRLAAIAMKSGNLPVGQELMARGRRVLPSIVVDYLSASYPRDAKFQDEWLTNIDVAFLRALYERDVRLRMGDVSSLIKGFLERRAPVWKGKLSGGREFFQAVRAVLRPEDACELISYAVACAGEVSTQLAPHNTRPSFESEVRALLEAPIDAPPMEVHGPRP